MRNSNMRGNFKLRHISLAALVVLLLATASFAQQAINWSTQADLLRGRNGLRVSYRCPSNGTASSRLWGSGIYTDDSSICTAAVHAGVINVRDGGVVTIEIQPGSSSYAASYRNGINSHSYGSWRGSFVVIGGRYDEAEKRFITWNTQADTLRGRNGKRFSYICPANGTASSRLWGSGVYTDDSSICTAAVHAGLITVRNGGTVTIEIRPGQSSYEATLRNGVNSRSYGSWKGSFVFVR